MAGSFPFSVLPKFPNGPDRWDRGSGPSLVRAGPEEPRHFFISDGALPVREGGLSQPSFAASQVSAKQFPALLLQFECSIASRTL
jgi:hypothetical protein